MLGKLALFDQKTSHDITCAIPISSCSRFDFHGQHGCGPSVFAQNDVLWKSPYGQQVCSPVSAIGIREKTDSQTQACFVLHLHHMALRGVIKVPEMGFDGIGLGLGQMPAMPGGHLGLILDGFDEVFTGVLVSQDGVLG